MDCSLFLLLQSRREPVETLVQTIASGGTACLDVPLSVTQAVQTELVGHLGSAHGLGKILLVGEDQQDRLSQLVLVQHAVKLVAGCVRASTTI